MNHTYQKPLAGKSVGIVFGAFAPLHQGHLDLILQAKKENDGGCIVIVCGYDGDKGEPLIPHGKRYRYARKLFADDDLVAVYPINDTELGIAEYPDGWDGWMGEFFRIWEIAVVSPDTTHRRWYVGEPDYYEGLTNRFGEEAIYVNRTENLISGTMIRNNPIRYWDRIAQPFRAAFSTNILICGTASEGKTTMTADLGKYFGTVYSHEWARDYMDEQCVSDWEFDSMDFLAFLRGQYALNPEKIESPANRGVFFADTDAMVTKMYAQYYAKDDSCGLTDIEYNAIAAVADEITRKSRWDRIYLLCPHGKFVDDHQRYMAHSGDTQRWELFDLLCEIIREAGLWEKTVVLDDGYYNNFKHIVNDVKELMAND